MHIGANPLAAINSVALAIGRISSLVEMLPRGVGLEDLRRLNAEGLASGIGIEELNARRSEMSLL